jgi:hypothetical protein
VNRKCSACGKDVNEGVTTVMPFYTHQKEYPLCKECKAEWSNIFSKHVSPLRGHGNNEYQLAFNKFFYAFLEGEKVVFT